MADQLCTPEDLASALQADLDASTATLWVECATAVVQAAAGGQRIVEVVDDTFEILGTTDSWLDLPQIPVTAVEQVELDGDALTAGVAGDVSSTYRRHGNRLWRGDGWQQYAQEPSTATGVYTHGYPTGSQELQLGRRVVLAIAQAAYSNPSGASRESIDDYSVQFEVMTAILDASPHLKAALRKQYGRRGGLVRIG